MLNTQYESNSIIIAPSHLHTSIKEYLINNNNSFNVNVTSLNMFLDSLSEERVDDVQLMLSYYNVLKSHKEEFNLFKTILFDYTFLSKIKELIKDIKIFNLDISNVDNFKDKEIYNITKLLLDIKTKEDLYLNNINNVLDKHIYVVNDYYKPYDLFFVNKLIEKGATSISTPKYESNINTYYATNIANEVDSVVQDILLNGYDLEDVNIVILQDEYEQKLLEASDRYKIKIACNKDNPTIKKFNSLISYLYDRSNENLINVLNCNALIVKYKHFLIEYLNITNLTINDSFDYYANLTFNTDLISDRELNYFKNLELKAHECKELLLDILGNTTYNTLEELLDAAYKLLIKDLPRDKFTSKNINQITNCCNNISNLNLDDLPFFQSILKTLPIKEKLLGIEVSKMNQIVYDKKYKYILGVNNKNYPGFKSHKGIISESIYNNTTYPSIQERFTNYMNFINKLFESSENIKASYSISDYHGKPFEIAYELEQIKTPIKYPYHEAKAFYNHETLINQEYAKTLNLIDNIFECSASRLETFAKCNYAHFLKYNLKLREPQTYKIEVNHLGTILHKIFEELYKNSTDNFNIEDFISKCLIDFKSIYNLDDNYYTILYSRIKNAVHRNKEILDGLLNDDNFKNVGNEEKILKDYIFNDITVRIKGIIDRVDESDNYVRIIDYKSSSKKFEASKFACGNQIQLAIYTDAYESDKRNQGSYYYNFYPSALKEEDCSSNDLLELKLSNQKNHNLKGIHFYDTFDTIDAENRLFSGVNLTATGKPRKVTTKNIDEFKQQLSTILESILNEILNGNIYINPIKDACKFCHYNTICKHSKNIEFKHQPYIETNNKSEEEGGNYE